MMLAQGTKNSILGGYFMKTMTGTTLLSLEETSEFLSHIGEKISLHGSVYKIRKMSGFSFLLLRTKDSIIQCIYEPTKCDFDLHTIKEESCVVITAEIVAEPRSKTGWELHLFSLKVLSEPMEELPIVINQKNVATSLDTLLDFRQLTLRNERERTIFKIQEGIVKAFRLFLTEQKFTEVHTPKIVSQGAEGGANIFRLDYFGNPTYLTQSPQFYKQMLVGVYERVFEIAPVFRAEKHDTSRHLNEYVSVDFEMGYLNSFEDLMEMETAMLRFTIHYLKEQYGKELALLNAKLPEITEIPVLKFKEAKEIIAKVYQREIKDFEDFEPEEEKLLSQWIQTKTGSDFVFVTHYPTKKRPFYAKEDESCPEETLSFDLFFRGIEITTGGQRIHDYEEQVAKMKQRNMDISCFESYLNAHKYGLPPHGGLGLGLERFTAKLLGYENVRYATLFPRDIHRVTP